jgi:hypothetical protein
MTIESKLSHLVTRYDANQEKRARYYNPYALGLYLAAVDRVIEDIAKGMSLPDAINNNFNDRLAAYLLKHAAR